jgi:hypothetical protein
VRPIKGRQARLHRGGGRCLASRRLGHSAGALAGLAHNLQLRRKAHPGPRARAMALLLLAAAAAQPGPGPGQARRALRAGAGRARAAVLVLQAARYQQVGQGDGELYEGTLIMLSN